MIRILYSKVSTGLKKAKFSEEGYNVIKEKLIDSSYVSKYGEVPSLFKRIKPSKNRIQTLTSIYYPYGKKIEFLILKDKVIISADALY